MEPAVAQAALGFLERVQTRGTQEAQNLIVVAKALSKFLPQKPVEVKKEEKKK
jgi:hypothetical protein